jgi:hypothetical protein
MPAGAGRPQTGSMKLWTRSTMRRATLALTLSLAALLPLHGRAESGVTPLVARSSIDFRVVIPAMVRVKTVVQPARLNISRQHVEQGYIDVDDESSLLVTSNSPTGYTISIAFERGLFSRIEVRTAHWRVEVSGGAGSMHVHSGRVVDSPLRLGYRLYLNPEAGTGEYRWPVALGFAANGA